MTSRKKLKPPQQEKGKKLVTPSNKQEIPPEQQPPVFSLRYLEGEYCLTKCDKDEQAAFALKIHRLSKLTWSQIQSLDFGFWICDFRLTSSLKKRLEQRIFSFVLKSSAPLLPGRTDFSLFLHEWRGLKPFILDFRFSF
jgi:hypothetical protein